VGAGNVPAAKDVPGANIVPGAGNHRDKTDKGGDRDRVGAKTELGEKADADEKTGQGKKKGAGGKTGLGGRTGAGEKTGLNGGNGAGEHSGTGKEIGTDEKTGQGAKTEPGAKTGPDAKTEPDAKTGPGAKTEPDAKTGDGAKDSTGKKSDKNTNKKRTAKDSTAIKTVAPQKSDSVLQMKGWLAGVGLNQFFTVGRQEQSKYNSSGTTGGLTDYIPVPMVRYYFSRKLYVQLEAQFNTPQYTSKDLLANVSRPDSTTLPGRVLQSKMYIKKLFYFNLPLSVHYSPIPNLYLGAGIQYARLTNGVALFSDSSHRIFTNNDSLVSAKVMSFKNDTTYSKLKTNEFRMLLDLNYNFKRWIIGVRYNRALSDFIHLQLYNNQLTQSRNSSFQVYLRYIIWDGRKKTFVPR
jgi:hypothetical protein